MTTHYVTHIRSSLTSITTFSCPEPTVQDKKKKRIATEVCKNVFITSENAKTPTKQTLRLTSISTHGIYGFFFF